MWTFGLTRLRKKNKKKKSLNPRVEHTGSLQNNAKGQKPTFISLHITSDLLKCTNRKGNTVNKTKAEFVQF